MALLATAAAQAQSADPVLKTLQPTVAFPVHILAPPGRPMSTLAARFLVALQASLPGPA